MAQRWREGIFSWVVTTQGQALQVLYPGRPAPGMGPDFLDALLITKEGEFVRGDVEVHISQRDWHSHGHHRDPRYNRVVLHLFLYGRENGRGKENGTWLEAGTQAPEVLLSSLSRADIPLKSAPTLRSNRRHAIAAPMEGLRALPPRELERALDEAGERRFMGKASAMLKGFQRGDAQQVLYSGLMEALGYSRNREPMSLLARGLPFSQLRQLIGRKPDRLALEALLLGAAGLLPHQRSLCITGWEEEALSRELTDIWKVMGKPLVVTTGMWSRAGLRPQNSPARRLAGASYLLERYWHSGLVEGLSTVLEKGTPREIERGLEVEGGGFWGHHLDFHHPVARAPALVGRGRAREMVINVLLPFFYARAHLLGDEKMRQRVLALYRSFSPGQDNTITREMIGILTTSKAGRLVVNSARRQQGLIHMYQVLQGQAK